MKKFILALVASLLLITSVLADGIKNPGGGNPASLNGYPFNVASYLTSMELLAVRAGTNTTDVGPRIASAINDCNTLPVQACAFYFPAGYYFDASCNRTIAKPFTIYGDGTRGLASGTGVSTVACGTNGVPEFSATDSYGLVRNIAGVTVGFTPASGSNFFKVTSSDQLQSVSFDTVMTDGFNIPLDIAVGSSFHVVNSLFQNSTSYCMRINNTLNHDAGDQRVAFNWCYPDGSSAPGGIRWESGGGIHFVSNTIISNNGNVLPVGFSFNSFGGTVEWSLVDNKVDVTGPALDVVTSPPRGMIASNTFITRGNGPSMNIAQGSQIMIAPNLLISQGSPTGSPIVFGGVQTMTVQPQITSGFTASTLAYSGSGTPTGIIDFSQASAPNVFDPTNSHGGLAFSNGNLRVSATATNASGAVARALRNGFQGTTFCEFTITTIGSAGGTGVGIINAAQDPHSGFLGSSNNSIGYYGDGSVFLNNATLTTLAAYTTGDVIGMAYNPVTKKIWWRKNAGGWNNDVIGNQNPDLGVGGISVAVLGSPVWPATDIESATGVITANWGATSYTNTPPYSFGNW